MRLGKLRVCFLLLFTFCLFSALFQGHFQSVLGFLLLIGLTLPSYKQRKRMREEMQP
jgi:hypothetical protein